MITSSFDALRRCGVRLAISAALLALVGCGHTTTSSPNTRYPTGLSSEKNVMRAHFIDIGQGLAVLLELPCAAVLIDAGGEKNASFDSDAALIGYLNAFFATRPDLERTFALVLVTHPHVDHTRGLPQIMEHYRVLNVVTNGQTHGSGSRQQTELQEWAQRNDAVRYHPVNVSEIPTPNGLTNNIIDPIECAEVDPQLRVLWGQLGADPGWGGNRWGKTHFRNGNNHSVVLRVDFGQASALFAGDMEPPAIAELLKRTQGSHILDADLYQVAHHGSSNGTTPALVDAVTPEIAVFASGPAHRQHPWTAWKYGHPRLGVYDMLRTRITRTRTPITAHLGVRGTRFVPRQVSRAIYAVGWDGTVVAEAFVDGTWFVHTTGP